MSDSVNVCFVYHTRIGGRTRAMPNKIYDDNEVKSSEYSFLLVAYKSIGRDFDFTITADGSVLTKRLLVLGSKIEA